MLIRFEFENWMSYKGRNSFSTIATREKQHGGRLPKVNRYRVRVSPVGAIFGGNASGKTSFVAALFFMQRFVTAGVRPQSLIPVRPYVLDAENANARPSIFSVSMLIDERIYEYSFVITRTKVLRESLKEVVGKTERFLFERKEGQIDFHGTVPEASPLFIIFDGTQDNQFFLTNSVFQKRKEYFHIYNWFAETLRIVAPDSRFEDFTEYVANFGEIESDLNALLGALDTGIHRIGLIEIPMDKLSLPPETYQALEAQLKDGRMLMAPYRLTEVLVFQRKAAGITAYVLKSYHLNERNEEVEFEMDRESDGTRRVIALMPVFMQAVQSAGKVFVIDELDRSLHSIMTRELLQHVLDRCNGDTRSQILFTTHDLMLMDQDILRRDEMWVTERDKKGESTLRGVSEYVGVRYDKNLLKSYLDGAFGGVPSIRINKRKDNKEDAHA